MSGTDGRFYTMKGYQLNEMKGYQLNESIGLTSAMEDYLEMICRLTGEDRPVRVSDLSAALHVTPSSVTKMVQHLGDSGYILAEKYGGILLTDKGRAAGDYLLYRHNVIQNFLCALNGTENELEQTEKIEHFISRETVGGLERLTRVLLSDKNPGNPPDGARGD